MYYVLEIEMSVELKEQLDSAAEQENLTPEQFIVRAMTDFLNNPEIIKPIKAEYDALPDNEKIAPENLRIIRMFPVHESETEEEARAIAILKEHERYIPLPEISSAEFIEHIDKDDFPLKYGNPVIINRNNGQRLVCLTWELYARIMKLSGRDVEIDEINRTIEKSKILD